MSFTIDNQPVMFDLATLEALGVGRVRYADDFNNASNLGKGTAFERNW
jgi:hypothetical protein